MSKCTTCISMSSDQQLKQACVLSDSNPSVLLHLYAGAVLLQRLQPGDPAPALTPAAACAEALAEVDGRACQQLQALVLVLDQGTYLATPLLLLVALRFGQLPNILLQVLWCKGLDDYVMRAQLLQEVSPRGMLGAAGALHS